MKKIIILLFLSLTLSASQCKKEGDDCHYGIKVLNKSSSKVIYSLKLSYGGDSLKCLLQSIAELEPNNFYEQMLKMCWEDELKFRNFEFYIVDPSHFNAIGFYDCDSIEYYNTILKHYIITSNDIETLKANNWTITYP
jgi:hypothetical protein